MQREVHQAYLADTRGTAREDGTTGANGGEWTRSKVQRTTGIMIV